ncbi:cytochrome P450 [Actinocrispum wychmicini]|uniref:Cytochrome P450 n=1 Tax=Actinocrispum wychmicini TaxID=1213861 RepID=A0A4V2S5V8_9PSEU|nr:cytochrome P450 [Actinocrispum wychmicini]TCO53640.1 cytochrome P450 [Actinocrispum wychmicini]
MLPVHIQRNKFDPVPELARLRLEQPISPVSTPWGLTGWLATRYDDVREVLSDTARFSNAPGRRNPRFADLPARNGFLLTYDPPDHTTLRRMLTPEFTVRRMNRLRPRIEALVTDHLDAMARSGPPADLVSDFALPIPSLVICELLGVPYADREQFQRLTGTRLDMSLTPDDRAQATIEAREYMAGLVARQRADPGDDMIGMLIREHGDEIDDFELTGVADLLLIAGHETTSNMLGLGTLLLLRHPEQAAEVRTGENVAEAIEELLRYLSIVHMIVPRTAREDVVLSGQRIAAGEVVICSLAAANRDPAFGEDLDSFDIRRKISAHMAFGHGIHHCLGAPLARMEMTIAFPALLRRFPDLRLAVPFEDVPFRSYTFVFGLESMPVTW